MSIIITAGASTIAPTEVLGLQSQRTGRNIIHEIPGSESESVTLRPATPRTGTIVLGFSGPTAEGDSFDAENLHATGGVFTVVAAERPSLEMSYVVQDGGRISRDLEEVTRDAWIVTIDFREVIS